jgi:hypothetical protein
VQTQWRRALPLGFLLLATLPAGRAWADPPAWNPKAAAAYLDGRGEAWLNWSGAARGQGTACVSCHTTLSFALARPALGAPLGESAAGAVEQRFLDTVRKRVANWGKIVAEPVGKDPFVPFYAKERKPSALGTEAVLNALVLVNNDARRAKGVLSEPTRQALAHLWEQQQADGAWLWLDFGLRPWEADAAYYGAALAAVAVGTAGPAYYDREELRPKVAALRKYLAARYATQPLHHRVMALWAAAHLPGALPEAERKKLVAEVLDAQGADGGWSLAKLGRKTTGGKDWPSHGSYPEGAGSDGYATGLVVLALKRAGVAADDARLQKAVAWLTARQQQEGTWPATYPNRPRDPQTNVGRFLRDAATAFAVLALTESK